MSLTWKNTFSKITLYICYQAAWLLWSPWWFDHHWYHSGLHWHTGWNCWPTEGKIHRACWGEVQVVQRTVQNIYQRRSDLLLHWGLYSPKTTTLFPFLPEETTIFSREYYLYSRDSWKAIVGLRMLTIDLWHRLRSFNYLSFCPSHPAENQPSMWVYVNSLC